MKDTIHPPVEPSAASWLLGWELRSGVSQGRAAPRLAEGYFLAFKGRGCSDPERAWPLKTVSGLVPGDTGATENQVEDSKAFKRNVSAWTHPEQCPGCTQLPRSRVCRPVSAPDKWVNADSSLSHSQMGLGLKFK